MRKNILFVSIFVLFFNIHIYANELPQMKDAPMSTEFLNYINVKQRSENLSGYIPEPYPIPYIDREISENFPATYSSNLENSYNTGNHKNFISPVKNQNKDGVCWSFSSTSVLESSLLKQTGNALDTYDFSENHMRYSLSYQGNNPLGFIRRYDAGGNFAQALTYWTRSKTNGPVLEIDDIYSSGMGDSGIRDISITNEKPVTNYYVSKAIQLSNLPKEATDLQKENRIREIKQLIMDYGVVDSSYYTEDEYYSDDTNAYFYDGNKNISNHAVSIVGWDDNFSKSEFKIQPPKDGAFVIKNNWGSNWNLDGYFYISYYDKNITKAINTVATVENKDFFDTIYEYDPFGKISSTSYIGKNVNVYANMFNKTLEHESLTAISTYCLAPDSYFKVYITDSDSFADFKEVKIKDLVKSEYGYNVSDTGYITFKLESPVPITNDKFGVAIEVYNTLTTNDKVYTVPLEQKVDNYSPATQNSGESFMALNIEDLKSGYFLTDVSGREENPTNVCIKAFTKPITYEIKIDNTITGGTIRSNLSTAKYGEEINLTIIPDTGMKLKSLSYNNGINNTIITGTNFKMPANNITIKAKFEFASSVKRLEKAIESANEIYYNSNSNAEELVTAIGDLLEAMTELQR